jgi:hypothetical protein
MSLIVEDTGGSFESTPTGSHLARCYRIVDVGTQKSEYQGQVKYLRKVMLGWEIHGVNDDGTPIKMKDGRPFAMFKNYTMSWSDKATLRIDLQAWRSKPFSAEEMRRFDLKTVLGAWCMLNVVERQGNDGKMYVNVANISPVPAMIKQAGLPVAINKNEMFSLSEPDMEMFNTFSDSLKKKIQASPEWEKLQKKPGIKEMIHGTPPVGNEDIGDDDIPF